MRTGAMESSFTERHRLTRGQMVRKMFWFLGAEISAGVIQVLVFTLLAEGLRLTYWASYLPAIVMSVLWSFTANRKFTFKSVSNVPIAMMKIAVYYCVFIPASTWWGDELNATTWAVGRDAQYYIVLISSMILNLVTEFMVYRFWVYPHSINTSAAGRREQLKYDLR